MSPLLHAYIVIQSSVCAIFPIRHIMMIYCIVVNVVRVQKLHEQSEDAAPTYSTHHAQAPSMPRIGQAVDEKRVQPQWFIRLE